MSLSVNSRLPYSSETLSVAILPLLLSLNFPGGTVRGLLLAGALVRTPLYRAFVSQCWKSLFLRNFEERKVEGRGGAWVTGIAKRGLLLLPVKWIDSASLSVPPRETRKGSQR